MSDIFFRTLIKFYVRPIRGNFIIFEFVNSMAQSRVKAAYNAAKSLLITRFISPGARVLDFGGGSDVLKYDPHDPEYVVQVHNSHCSLDFANRKNIKYAYGVHVADVFTAQLSSDNTTVQYVGNIDDKRVHIPHRVRLAGVQLISSFSILETCTNTNALRHVCRQVSELLAPGGSWIGSITNAASLVERCDATGHYEDNYCTVNMDETQNAYWFATHQRHQKQYLWSIQAIARIAKEYGLVLCLQESLLDVLGNARIDSHYSRIRHSSQLNGKLKLHLDDLRPLSLLTFFCFLKPVSEPG